MIDDDIDAPEDFEKQPDQPPEKPSFKEVWENNPALKLAAIVLGGVVLLAGYAIFFSKTEDTSKARINMTGDARSSVVPGKTEADPAYVAAMQDKNKKDAATALRTNTSQIPLPVAIANTSTLQIPAMPDKPKDDVLKEWKKVADQGRMQQAKDQIEEENSAPPPDAVPMVQPIRPNQQVAKLDPNYVKRLAEQMRVIITAQSPAEPKLTTITMEESPYRAMKRQQEEDKRTAAMTAGGSTSGTTVAAASTTGATGAAAAGKDIPKVIVPAGSVAYGQLMNELNSDIQGPVLVQILSGPFAGGRAIGKMEVKDEYIVLTFSRIVKDTVSYKVDGVALDENTTLAGQATDVDHHYFVRVILPAAAKFIEGYSDSIAQTGQTVDTTQGVGTTTSQPKPDAKESIYKGLSEASKNVSDMLTKYASRPITVKIAKGTTMGIFFTDTVTTKDAEK